MTIRIIAGDCRDVLPTLAPYLFDCAIVDPPYGETKLAWDHWPAGWPAAVLRVIKPTGSMWVFGSMRMFLDHWAEFDGWRLSHDVVWEKHNGSGFFNDRFRRVHEIALHLYPATSAWASIFKSPQFTNDATARTVRKKARPAHWTGATGETIYRSEDGGPKLMRSVLFVRSENGRAEHPTQKPIGIVDPLLRYACPPGGSVLDPFSGSGTTAICAKRCGMHATLIEADPAHCELSERRVANDAPLFAGLSS
jgi:site-specific DNA-methyltransferase (adenine-specific)